MEKSGSKDKSPGLESLLIHSVALDSKARSLLSLSFFICRIGTIPTFTGP